MTNSDLPKTEQYVPNSINAGPADTTDSSANATTNDTPNATPSQLPKGMVDMNQPPSNSIDASTALPEQPLPTAPQAPNPTRMSPSERLTQASRSRTSTSTGPMSIHDKLKLAKSVRRHEAICHVAQKKVMLAPLTVGADTDIRTMISNIDMYESLLVELIYSAATFAEQISFDDFTANFSQYDKKVMLYSIYESTYGHMGEVKLTCQKCNHEHLYNTHISDLKFNGKQWDKDVPFTEHFKSFVIDVDSDPIISYDFKLRVASIKNNLDLIKLIDIDKLKLNIKNANMLFDQSEFLTLITDSIVIHSYDDVDGERVVVTDTIDRPHDILEFVKNHLDIKAPGKINAAYADEYDYLDPFYTNVVECPNCADESTTNIDIEIALMGSFLRLGAI